MEFVCYCKSKYLIYVTFSNDLLATQSRKPVQDFNLILLTNTSFAFLRVGQRGIVVLTSSVMLPDVENNSTSDCNKAEASIIWCQLSAVIRQAVCFLLLSFVFH
jgi:hypothetical protein